MKCTGATWKRRGRSTERVDGGGSGRVNRVRIYVDIGAPKESAADSMFWPPATALLLAELLMAARYRVEMIAVGLADCVTEDHEHSVLFQVTLKQFDQPLNISSLTPITLAGYWRIYGFQSIFSLPIKVSFELGWSTPISPAALRHTDNRGIYTIILTNDIRTKADAVLIMSQFVRSLNENS